MAPIKPKHMDQFQRALAISRLDNGERPSHIAKDMGVSPSSITRLRKKVREVGKVRALKNKPGQGRPQKASLQDIRIILKSIKKRPFLSCVRIKHLLAPQLDHLSVRMIQQTLCRCGYKAFRAAKKPMLTAAMKAKRVKFATEHLHWTPEMWSKVLFSDESTFRLVRGTSKTVRRRWGHDRYSETYTIKTIKHPGSVMIWGAFDGATGRAGIRFLPKDVTMNSVEYVATLQEHMLDFYQRRANTHFLQDGAPCHRARKTQDWFQANGVQVMPWPGNSPDLNPIENMWHVMKTKLEEKEVKNVQEMKAMITRIWCMEITPEYCANLSASMPAHLMAVLEANGGPTKY